MPYVSKSKANFALWHDVIADAIGTDDREIGRRLELVERWRADHWAFLTGTDLDGKPIIWTVDELDAEAPWKPFPGSRPEFGYLRHVAAELMGPHKVVLVDKTRQVYATTLACQLIRWINWRYEEQEIFFSRVHEESATKLINDKIRRPHGRMPVWVQRIMPITSEPKNVITWTATGGTLTAVSQNFAESDARGPTASLTVVDEAAYQPYFPEIYRAILPMRGRLWGLTTANVGNRGAQVYRDLIMDGRPGYVGDGDDDAA